MNRIQLLNQLIETFNYQSYLEIGCRDNSCFSEIKIADKVGVDPEKGGTFRGTSDAYFKRNKAFWRKKKFDLIFIDGLHWSEQVEKDISNSLKVLNPNGTIVMHDCNPRNAEEAAWPYAGSYFWNGDTWKAYVHRRTDPNLDMAVGDFDHGCGVIRVRPNTDLIDLKGMSMSELEFADLEKNKAHYLRLMSPENLLSWIKG